MCGRCHRLNADCAYPAPPDRRGPRGKRKQRPLREEAVGTRDGVGVDARKIPGAGSGSPETPASEEQASNQHSTPRASIPGTRGLRQDIGVPANAPSDDAVDCTSTGLVTEYSVLSNASGSRHYWPFPQLLTWFLIRLIKISCARQRHSQTGLPSTQVDRHHCRRPRWASLCLRYTLRACTTLPFCFTSPCSFSSTSRAKFIALCSKPCLRWPLCMSRLTTPTVTQGSRLTETSRFVHAESCENRSTTHSNTELHILSAYQSSGLPWAKAALEEATQLAMQSPSLMAVQALQCIQIYYFAIGQPHSAHLCLGQLQIS